jgi:hypothetical protein
MRLRAEVGVVAVDVQPGPPPERIAERLDFGVREDRTDG